MDYPDWTFPIVFVLQEGELWPINEWVARMGEKKSWRVVDTVNAMATDTHELYTVPANKKLYISSGMFSNDVNMRHQLYYLDDAIYIADFYQGGYVTEQNLYVPCEAITAGQVLWYAAHNLTGGGGGTLALIHGYELDV